MLAAGPTWEGPSSWESTWSPSIRDSYRVILQLYITCNDNSIMFCSQPQGTGLSVLFGAVYMTSPT